MCWLQAPTPAITAASLTQITLAIGALGTAAFGFVDATKAIFGGPSNFGYFGIKKRMKSLLLESATPAASPPTAAVPGAAPTAAASPGLSWDEIASTLYANWINGMASSDQKAVAKAFVKLRFNPTTAKAFADLTGVDSTLLTSVANKVSTAAPLSLNEADVNGRFDLALSTMIDCAYQRGDQIYRNMSKVTAAVFAIALAVVANHHGIDGKSIPDWQALLVGAIATPLAPVAKDAASALQAASQALQAVRR
jgi:hypothetical protein